MVSRFVLEGLARFERLSRQRARLRQIAVEGWSVDSYSKDSRDSKDYRDNGRDYGRSRSKDGQSIRTRRTRAIRKIIATTGATTADRGRRMVSRFVLEGLARFERLSRQRARLRQIA